jgi:preprotein translocase subunit SecA
MLQRIGRLLSGDPIKKELDRYFQTVEDVNALEPQFEELSDEALCAKTAEFRARLAQGETLDDLLPEAFAAVREASKRTIGLRHFDVQLIGGIVLHQGKIAEMRTGEGKTLVATLALYLNGLSGEGVHLVTVNDYLARRDARWMGPIYQALGMSVGVLQMAAQAESEPKAYLVDLERSSPHEDQNQLRLVSRREAYQADITYGTNSEFGFDYLRDNLAMRLEDRVQRAHHYAIVDEVDNILIDEARTPLIISGPAEQDVEWYQRMAQVARQMRPEDFEIDEKERQVSLTEVGEAHVEELLGMQLRDPERPEDITPEQAHVLGYLEQSLRAQFLFKRNKDYIVQGGKVVIVDEFTGRLMPGRRWSEGLHQAIEAKEGVHIEPETITYATITIQNYFRMYAKLAGMTGTAATEAEEFDKIYHLGVVPIPTNLEYIASRPSSPLALLEAKDEEGYAYRYYAQRADPERKPVFWQRKDYPDQVYRTKEAKLRAITWEIMRKHVLGQPVLVGTTSVEASEYLSSRLAAEPLHRLLITHLVRDTWLEQHNIPSERIVAELEFLNVPLGELDLSKARQVARSVGITNLDLQETGNFEHLLQILELGEEQAPRLKAVLEGGIPHQVLNARKHAEESQIIARAGAFGTVTIATNMAGRGVDIKLGGELPENVLDDVIRVLRPVVGDPYDLTNEQRELALKDLSPEEYGVYEPSLTIFLRYMDEMRRVRALGGLYVIGSERHEARRIDNQLRGRSARQGDPGASRFYLSLEDDVLRLFGGQQVDSLMRRLSIDDSMPIESGLIGRLVEQAQERVEGANFDVRKHLLEYDDVLNAQRQRIYGERDRIFTQGDVTEDVLDMLRTELQRRIPESLKDEEGPWKLLAFLEQIQPPISFNNGETLIPSFTQRLVLDEIQRRLAADGDAAGLGNVLMQIAREALESENEHILRYVRNLLDHLEEEFESSVKERLDILDIFWENLGSSEEGTDQKQTQSLLEDLSAQVRLPLKLSAEQARALSEGDEEVRDALKAQIEDKVRDLMLTRLAGGLRRRLGDAALQLQSTQFGEASWEEIGQAVYSWTENLLESRVESLLGENGLMSLNIRRALQGLGADATGEGALLSIVMQMPQGVRSVIDPHTHQRVQQGILVMTFVHLAAKWLESLQPQQVVSEVLDHLETAQHQLQLVWGESEFSRLGMASVTLGQIHDDIRQTLAEMLEGDSLDDWLASPLAELPEEIAQPLTQALGWHLQNEIYRQILLSTISQLWVDYLTEVEALRVSIGLEAYAQRDPLVRYKSRASELFAELLANIRLGVISRMFLVQPQTQPQPAPEAAGPVPEMRGQADAPVPAGVSASPTPASRSKRRHRHG